MAGARSQRGLFKGELASLVRYRLTKGGQLPLASVLTKLWCKPPSDHFLVLFPKLNPRQHFLKLRKPAVSSSPASLGILFRSCRPTNGKRPVARLGQARQNEVEP
jgi:hypothetical protein